MRVCETVLRSPIKIICLDRWHIRSWNRFPIDAWKAAILVAVDTLRSGFHWTLKINLCDVGWMDVKIVVFNRTVSHLVSLPVIPQAHRDNGYHCLLINASSFDASATDTELDRRWPRIDTSQGNDSVCIRIMVFLLFESKTSMSLGIETLLSHPGRLFYKAFPHYLHYTAWT